MSLTSLFHATNMRRSILMEAPVEVAIHLCLLACAHPQEKLAKRAPGEVAIHLCQMASAHP